MNRRHQEGRNDATRKEETTHSERKKQRHQEGRNEATIKEETTPQRRKKRRHQELRNDATRKEEMTISGRKKRRHQEETFSHSFVYVYHLIFMSSLLLIYSPPLFFRQLFIIL